MTFEVRLFEADVEDIGTTDNNTIMAYQGYVFQQVETCKSDLMLHYTPGRRGLEDLTSDLVHFIDNTNLHCLPSKCSGTLVAYSDVSFHPNQATLANFNGVRRWHLCVVVRHTLESTILCKCSIDNGTISVYSDHIIRHTFGDTFQLRYLNVITSLSLASDGYFECSIHGPDIPVPFSSFDEKLQVLYHQPPTGAIEPKDLFNCPVLSDHFGGANKHVGVRPIRTKSFGDDLEGNKKTLVRNVTNYPLKKPSQKSTIGVNVSTSRSNAHSYFVSRASILDFPTQADQESEVDLKYDGSEPITLKATRRRLSRMRNEVALFKSGK